MPSRIQLFASNTEITIMCRSFAPLEHVAVVDPSPADYRDLTLAIGRRGWHAHFLTSGAAALQFGRRQACPLWLVNLRLPDMDGIEVAGLLREASGARVFIVSDAHDPAGERRACRAGADCYLCKDASRSLSCEPLFEMLTRSRHGPPLEARRALGRAPGARS